MTGPWQPVLTGIGFNTNPRASTSNTSRPKPVFDMNVAAAGRCHPLAADSVINQTVSTSTTTATAAARNFGGDVPFPGHAFPGQDINDFVIEAQVRSSFQTPANGRLASTATTASASW